jgi:phosphatidylinositol alpha-1,6-mannosyltransferase
LGAQVRFSGAVSRAELLAAYRDADLFVLTPRATASDVEGFGIVYVEAAASGVPVLGSRAGGATDAIAEGESGLLVDDSSPAAIAAGIERFAASRERFTPARVAAFAEAFRWPALAEKLGREIAARL